MLSSRMQEGFGGFGGRGSIQRSPPRWVDQAFTDRAIAYLEDLEERPEGLPSGRNKRMKVTTTWLQMSACPGGAVPPPREGLAVVHARKPTVAYYRFLYDAVGREYGWTSRRKLSDAELAALLGDPRIEVHVVMADGVPAGFAELDRRTEGEIQLMQFGLVPEFIGQGLGRWFLRWAVHQAWSYAPRRLWLHTCTKDHPAALPNYLKAGFVIYEEASCVEEA